MTLVEEDLPTVHPVVLASDQIIAANRELDRHPDEYLHWPYPELDALAGPIAPGETWIIAAASGGGKTTFMASTLTRWRAARKRVYVMALETQPKAFRTYLACMDAGIHPGDVLSGKLHDLPNGAVIRQTIKALLMQQTRPPYIDTVMVNGLSQLTLAGLTDGLKEAKAWGADVIVIDHMDHIAGGNGANGPEDAKRLSDAMLHAAQANELRIVATSQLNQQASKGGYLAKYLPPKDEHVAFGAMKRRNASGMLGLFRPLRALEVGESEKMYRAAMSAAANGRGDVQGMLAQNTMGVSAMKLRHFGAREGQTIRLAVRHGKVESVADANAADEIAS